jgi:hypothetical protein
VDKRDSEMSKADELRQYAEEALRWAQKSTTKKEKKALIEIARKWTQAAEQTESILVPSDESQAPWADHHRN